MAALFPALVALVALAPPGIEKAQEHERKALEALGKSDLPGARRHSLEALRLAEKALGKGAADLAPWLEKAANAEQTSGDFGRAGDLYERLLPLKEQAHGKDSVEVARVLDRIGYQRWMQGRYRQAEPILDRARAIHEKVLGKDNPLLVPTLTTMAVLYQQKMDYTRAEQLQRAGLAILEKAHGPKSNELISAVFQLGWLALARERFDEAEAHFQRILAILKADPWPDEAMSATFLESLGRVYTQRGAEDRAKAVLDQALAIHERALAAARKDPGIRDYKVQMALARMSMHFTQREAWKEAVGPLNEMIAMMAKQHGAESMATGAYRMQLASALQSMGRLDEARTELEIARKAEIRFLGKARASSTTMLLANLESVAGRWKKADGWYAQAVASYRKTFGDHFPSVAFFLERRALMHWAMGKTARSVALLAEAMRLIEPMLQLVLHSGTEQDRRTTMKRYGYHLHEAVSLHVLGSPKRKDSRRLAMETILQRKGRLLDASADAFGTLHRRLKGDDRAHLERLLSARARLARLVLKGPGTSPPEVYAREVASLETTIRDLEALLTRRSARFRAQTLPTSLTAVEAAVPEKAALVEIVRFNPIDPKKPDKIKGFGLEQQKGEARYAAYTLRRGEPIGWVDLGPAAPIDGGVTRLREALASPDRDDVRGLARAVDAMVAEPLRPLIGDASRVLIAPDGALNLLPFGALIDKQDRFLVRRYSFTYLTSGRDLLRLRVQGKTRSKPIVIADPAFGGQASDPPAPATRGRRSLDLRSMTWTRLPGTADEAEALGALLRGATVLVGSGATEEALKGLAGPRVLHVATHGFFLEDLGDDGPSVRPAENPLLRSGLALTGANSLASGAEDGILTALEATGLDLWGTRLVVLSACETGVGKVRNGDGVYGLRRALVIAGAETQVMSLWQVDDEATRDLMVGFYRRLAKGVGRTDALRRAQLQLLDDPTTEHPFYWAGFIASGQWTSMEGK